MYFEFYSLKLISINELAEAIMRSPPRSPEWRWHRDLRGSSRRNLGCRTSHKLRGLRTIRWCRDRLLDGFSSTTTLFEHTSIDRKEIETALESERDELAGALRALEEIQSLLTESVKDAFDWKTSHLNQIKGIIGR